MDSCDKAAVACIVCITIIFCTLFISSAIESVSKQACTCVTTPAAATVPAK